MLSLMGCQKEEAIIPTEPEIEDPVIQQDPEDVNLTNCTLSSVLVRQNALITIEQSQGKINKKEVYIPL